MTALFSRPGRWFTALLPLLMLAGVAALELSNREWTVLELAVLSPMLAATFGGPRLTALYGVLAVGVGVMLGLYDHLFGQSDGGPTAQAVRLGGVAVGGVLAVLVSRYNTRRETKLQNVTRVAEVAQQSILAAVPSSSGGLHFAVRYESAAAEARIGGDLYEVVDTAWGTRLLVGDVRGKGLDAVRIASRVLGCFRFIGRQAEDLPTVLAGLDAEVAEICGLDDFVTAGVRRACSASRPVCRRWACSPTPRTRSATPSRSRCGPVTACCSTPTASPRPATRRPAGSSRCCPRRRRPCPAAHRKRPSPTWSTGCGPGPGRR